MIVRNNKVLKVNHKWFKNVVDPYNPLGLPPYTVRVKCAEGRYPTIYRLPATVTLIDSVENIWDVTTADADWTTLFIGNSVVVLEILGVNSRGVVSMRRAFEDMTLVTSVPLFDTSSVTDMSYMFALSHNITTVPLFDTSSVTSMRGMFHNCKSLTSVPLFDTSNVTDMSFMFSYTDITSVPLFDTANVITMESMFIYNDTLTTVPLFNTSSVDNVNRMFYYCLSVESGALALYTQMSTQTTQPSQHNETFYECGNGTITGKIELAQIPVSWGGKRI